MTNGPIYIGGLDRSGKTTMQAFLTSHPRIAIPYVGSNLWRYFYGQYGNLARQENFERCFSAMLRYSHVQFLNPDPDRVRREFWQGEPSYARLFALLHAHYAQQQGKARWGDQTGLLECYVDHLFAAHPDAKMIQMVRDPRDRYEASLARAPKGKGRAGGATARWLYSVGFAARNARRYPDRYMIVRYETLVAQPAKTVAKVCHFLNEEYFPDMLSMNGSPEQRDKLASRAADKTIDTPVTTDFIGRYRGVVPDREIAFMQLVAKRKMRAFGYPQHPIYFPPAVWLPFALWEFPVNLVRAFAWLAREAVQDHLPQWFGRQPDDKTISPGKRQMGQPIAGKSVAR